MEMQLIRGLRDNASVAWFDPYRHCKSDEAASMCRTYQMNLLKISYRTIVKTNCNTKNSLRRSYINVSNAEISTSKTGCILCTCQKYSISKQPFWITASKLTIFYFRYS